MKITPSPLTAALAGLVAGLLMPFLWARFASPESGDSVSLVVSFLLVVALPAHALVVGFAATRSPGAGASIDAALLKRVGAWLLAAAVGIALGTAFRT